MPSEASQTHSVNEEKPFDKYTEIERFEQAIKRAKIDGVNWVETHPKVIEHYNPRGLGKAKYFIYSNVQVCEYGQSEKIQNEMDMPIYQRLHGGEEGIVEGTHTGQPVAIKKLLSNA